jgi:HK97 family phage portal protein
VRTPWSWLRSLLGRFRGDDPRREQRWFNGFPVAGLQLTDDEAMSLSTVWACVQIISSALSPMRWKIYQPVPGTKRRDLLVDDWKTWMLNTRPNPEMTAIAWREAMLFQAIPGGNAFSEIVTDKAGRARELWPLWSNRMRVRRDENWKLVYEYTDARGVVTVFDQSQIFHLKGPGLYGLMGENLVARAAKAVGVAAAQERFAASYFGQGAQPGGVLKHPGVLSDQAFERLKKDWLEKRQGPENAHKPMILEEGTEWEQTSVDPEKSQLIQSRKFSVVEICRYFGVPPHMVHDLDNATFSNIEHQSIEFVNYAVRPWERRLCQEADYKLFPQNRAPVPYTEIDTRPLTRGDAQSRALAAASWRQNGIMSANEIRAEEGLDDAGADADVLIVQSNMTTIEQLLEPPEPPALPPGSPAPAQSDGNDDTGDADRTDDPAEQPGTFALARQALIAALSSALERYRGRLQNQQRRPDRAMRIEVFRAQQAQLLAGELALFQAFSVKVLGRGLSNRDLGRAIELFEQGAHPETIVENYLKALPG